MYVGGFFFFTRVQNRQGVSSSQTEAKLYTISRILILMIIFKESNDFGICNRCFMGV